MPDRLSTRRAFLGFIALAAMGNSEVAHAEHKPPIEQPPPLVDWGFVISNTDKLVGKPEISTVCFLESITENNPDNMQIEYRGYPIEFLQNPVFVNMTKEERAKKFPSLQVIVPSVYDSGSGEADNQKQIQKDMYGNKIAAITGNVVRQQVPEYTMINEMQGQQYEMKTITASNSFIANSVLISSDQPTLGNK